MTRGFSNAKVSGEILLAVSAGMLLYTGSAHAGEDAVNRFARADTQVAGDCNSSRSEAADQPGCLAGSPAPLAAIQTPRARITVGRAVDLTGQEPVRYLSSVSLEEGRAYIMSSSGRLRDTVRLISPAAAPSISGTGDVPRGMPVRWGGVTSRFGMRRNPVLNQVRLHAGIDLRAATGDPVRATSGGVVKSAGWQGGYGLAVRIDHGKGLETRYAHLSRLNVAPGQTIRPGEVIGFVGSTGRSTGPHLHYEVRRNGQAVDPSSTLGK